MIYGKDVKPLNYRDDSASELEEFLEENNISAKTHTLSWEVIPDADDPMIAWCDMTFTPMTRKVGAYKISVPVYRE